MMNDYFLTAPNAETMVAVLKAVWETNNPPLAEGATPPEYSEQGWVVHGFEWVTTPASFDEERNITPPELKPGYHAMMRVHGAALGPLSIAMLAAAGIDCVTLESVENPPIRFQ
jgi:hypothetical protein